MANTYAATALQDARSFIKDDNNKKFEVRPTASNILTAFMRDREYTIPALQAIKEAEIQTTTALYHTRKDFTLNSSKSCAPTGETAGSSSVNLTWSQLGFTIRMETKKFHNNEIGFAEALAWNLLNAEQTFFTGASGIDSILYTYLEANKTGVNAISTTGKGHNTWVGGGIDNVQVANADKNRYYNYLTMEMAVNNYSSELMEIHPTKWIADRNFYLNQGQGNSTNTQFQFNDNVTTYASNLITPSGYNYTENYVVPVGGVAFLDWNDPLNREGKISGEKEWTIAPSTIKPELTYDVFIKESCADTTDNGGTKQDLVIDYEFTLNYAIAKQPFSTANETSIYKYVVLNS